MTAYSYYASSFFWVPNIHIDYTQTVKFNYVVDMFDMLRYSSNLDRTDTASNFKR